MLCSRFQSPFLRSVLPLRGQPARTGAPSSGCQLGLACGGVLLEVRGQRARCSFSRVEGPSSLTNSAALPEPLPCPWLGAHSRLGGHSNPLVFLFPTQTFADRPFTKLSSEYPIGFHLFPAGNLTETIYLYFCVCVRTYIHTYALWSGELSFPKCCLCILIPRTCECDLI